MSIMLSKKDAYAKKVKLKDLTPKDIQDYSGFTIFDIATNFS